jgi:hypothetical protein
LVLVLVLIFLVFGPLAFGFGFVFVFVFGIGLDLDLDLDFGFGFVLVLVLVMKFFFFLVWPFGFGFVLVIFSFSPLGHEVPYYAVLDVANPETSVDYFPFLGKFYIMRIPYYETTIQIAFSDTLEGPWSPWAVLYASLLCSPIRSILFLVSFLC